MQKLEMIEDQKQLVCSQQHNQPIITVILDPNLIKNQRLLCSECLEYNETTSKTIGFKKLLQIIEEVQINKLEQIEKKLNPNINQIENLLNLCILLKSNVNQQLDYLISLTKDWIKSLELIYSKQKKYSFFQELDNLIKDQTNLKINLRQYIKEINKINQSCNSKAFPKLNYFQQFEEYNKGLQILSSLQLDSEKSNSYRNSIQLFKQVQHKRYEQNKINKTENLEQKYDNQLALTQINQSIDQEDSCNSIVFNISGSIMFSTSNYDIKVWNFKSGNLQLLQTLKGHTNTVICLIQSKNKNSFISASNDKTLRFWSEIKSDYWKCLELQYKRVSQITCMILNHNEDQLFSGTADCNIKIWNVNFDKTELSYLYQLEKHTNMIVSLSLNQSENLLVSCGLDSQLIIWIKGQLVQEFKYVVNQSINDFGCKVKFLNDDQFIWVSGSLNYDRIYVYEIKNGLFQENPEKTIHLIENKQTDDYLYFPIKYNRRKNLIIVRHKQYIYFIRKTKEDKFLIVDKLNCETEQIYGTISEDAKYLVYWSELRQSYLTYGIKCL